MVRPQSFRRFNSSLEVIRLVVLMYVRVPLSLRSVEDLLFERLGSRQSAGWRPCDRRHRGQGRKGSHPTGFAASLSPVS
jgi:hypothetical protein